MTVANKVDILQGSILLNKMCGPSANETPMENLAIFSYFLGEVNSIGKEQIKILGKFPPYFQIGLC
jgi:hypothetical protein